MKTILFAIIFSLSVSAAFGQNAKNEDVKSPAEVPERLFAAMREKNFEAIRSLFIADGQLVAIDKPRDGKGISRMRVFKADAFAKMISEAKGAEFIEKMPSKELEINGDFALVTGRYTFHVGEKFSHCGVNSFHLVKTETGWKIANAASTLEFNCQ
jgi:hypothetical protein